MLVDLKNLKTYWINLSSHVQKYERMKKMFKDYNICNNEHFEGVILDPNDVIKDGSGLATHTLLTKIYNNNDFPCLVLEDDAKPTNTFKETYEIPDNCDALYLGVSRAGARGHQALTTIHDDNYFRVWNMLATHAVVYFSKQYVKNILDQGKIFLNKNIPYDIGIAELHCKYNIFTPEYPAFYQYDPDKTSKFDVEWYTKYQITPVRPNYKNIEFPEHSSVLYEANK